MDAPDSAALILNCTQYYLTEARRKNFSPHGGFLTKTSRLEMTTTKWKEQMKDE